MGILIDDLLRLSVLKNEKLESRVFNMNSLVEEIITEFKGFKEKDCIKWKIADLPDAFGDVRLIKRVWINLISNAVKFSKKSPGPCIEIEAEKNEDQVVYFIRDNGVGFNMSDESKLFISFQRLHPIVEFEGSGIGLSIVDRIIQKHGGEIWSQSEIGQGAQFLFYIQSGK